MGDGGKGSAPRPLGIDWDKFEENWDAIFGAVGNRSGADSGVHDGDAAGRDSSRGTTGNQESPEHKPSE